MIARIHPQALLSPASYNFSPQQEKFTIWMKSLILGGKGCTVFDSSGEILFRVDNYCSLCRSKVYLMDSRGEILFTILKKKHEVLGCWEGFRYPEKKEKPSFLVRKSLRNFLRGQSILEVIIGFDRNRLSYYNIESWTSKSACKIVDKFGEVVAQVKRKEPTRGVALGEDVLTMVVEPYVDHSLAMGLFVVHSLAYSKI